jgi:hypothetical protein
MIKLLGQILQQAVDYELIPRNPRPIGFSGLLHHVPPRKKLGALQVFSSAPGRI